jgi:hypothetical protein
LNLEIEHFAAENSKWTAAEAAVESIDLNFVSPIPEILERKLPRAVRSCGAFLVLSQIDQFHGIAGERRPGYRVRQRSA